MSEVTVRIENATSNDWHELKQAHGDPAVERLPLPAPSLPGRSAPLGEPFFPTIVVTIGTVTAAAALVAWICKQRSLQRTTLRITVASNKSVTTIDLSDERYAESIADAKLVSDLVKAGLEVASKEHGAS